MIGGPGADALCGGCGIDTVDYSSAANGVDISLGTAETTRSNSYRDEHRGDDFSSIENVVGTKFNDRLAGDAGDNVLEGRQGNDWIFGGGAQDTLFGGVGHDHLFGGAGDDPLFGGAGADYIDGGPGSDTVSYAGAAAGVSVSLDGTAARSGQDTIEGVENVRGSVGDDEIEGDAAANVLWGGWTGCPSNATRFMVSGTTACSPDPTLTVNFFWRESLGRRRKLRCHVRGREPRNHAPGASRQLARL